MQTPHSTTTPVTVPVDADLLEQARPGHGVPSQDPDPAAQVPLQAGEAQREADSVLTGGGVVAGLATGAAIGAAVAKPSGVIIGASVGGVAGALGGAATGHAMPADEAPTKPR